MYLKLLDDWVANSVDPDQTPQNAASDLGLYCLLRPIGQNTYSKYGIFINSNPSEILNLRFNYPGPAPAEQRINP